MTQPARRTFLPGHVVVIICSITIQLSNLARTIHLEQQQRFLQQNRKLCYSGRIVSQLPSPWLHS